MSWCSAGSRLARSTNADLCCDRSAWQFPAAGLRPSFAPFVSFSSWTLVVIVSCVLTVSAAEPSRILVPAYGNPCCGDGQALWRGLIQMARPGVLDVILNPNSGPGTIPIDSHYVSADGESGPLLELSQAGADVHGYVHTSWGQRPLPEVFAEIDRYFDSTYYRGADFQVDGIFVDEMSNDLAKLAYYESILAHVPRCLPRPR